MRVPLPTCKVCKFLSIVCNKLLHTHHSLHLAHWFLSFQFNTLKLKLTLLCVNGILDCKLYWGQGLMWMMSNLCKVLHECDSFHSSLRRLEKQSYWFKAGPRATHAQGKYCLGPTTHLPPPASSYMGCTPPKHPHHRNVPFNIFF